MPSIRHQMLKYSLKSMTLSLPLRGSDIEKLRLILDVTALGMQLPWAVHFKPIKIDHLHGEWIIPKGADKRKVILYFHGGGYALGSPHTHRSMMGQIGKIAGYPVLLIDYRKIPTHPYPAALEDALLSYEWLLKHGYLPNDIIIGGDSAGGGLAVASLLALKDKLQALPAACICLSPWLDLATDSNSAAKYADDDPLIRVYKMQKWGKIYANGHALENPYISPLKGDLKGLPPLFVQVSNSEVLYEDSLQLKRKIEASKGQITLQEWDGLMHWWHIFWRLVPEAEEALEEVSLFVQSIFEQK